MGVIQLALTHLLPRLQDLMTDAICNKMARTLILDVYRRTSGPGILGKIGALAFGIGVADAVFW
jgi:hypothetical protein